MALALRRRMGGQNPDNLHKLRDLLAQAVSILRDGRPVGTPAFRKMAITTLTPLVRAVESALADVMDADDAEDASVYQTVARQMASIIRKPEQDTYRALLDLCQVPADSPLLKGLSSPDSHAVTALSDVLLRVTARYESLNPGFSRGGVRRVVEVLYTPDGSGKENVSARTEQVHDWDLLTDEIRNKLRDGGTAVFQVFPGGV
ncbi:hypothetical protein AAH991_14325 [Microbispora sp. ZYX-F-249]|uniref:Uncharacterized protein n=1 Tax=Microbispora maris TaxID=3144104 RepID=A0ABV0ALW6_9ACTN